MLTDYYNLVDTGISKAGGRVVKFIVDRVLFIFPSDLAQEAVATLRDLKEVGDQWVRSYNPSGYVHDQGSRRDRGLWYARDR